MAIMYVREASEVKVGEGHGSHMTWETGMVMVGGGVGVTCHGHCVC